MPGGSRAAHSQPPAKLGDAGRALWSSIAGPYDLRPDELTVLARACSAADRIEKCEAALEAAGTLTSTGSMGQEVEHPMLVALTKHDALLQRLLASLKLPDEPGDEKPNQHREAGKARWAVRTA